MNTHAGSKLKLAPKLILRGNQTSIWFKDFKCNRTSNSNAKYHLNWNIYVQDYGSSRGQAFSKTLRFGIEPAVNRQPGFRRELVEQTTFLELFQMFSCLGSHSNLKFLSQLNFLEIFWKFWKCSSKYQLFYEHTRWFKTQVWISAKADTQGKSNFNMI